MGWKPIVVGVDTSPESLEAVRWATQLGVRLESTVRLVHAVESEWIESPAALSSEMERLFFEIGRRRISEALERTLPPDVTENLEVRPGRPAWVIEHFAHELDAGMVVLGGKHHSAMQRWLGGSTAHHVARKIDIPIAVTCEEPGPVRKVLVAVDLSHAAAPTMAWARDLANRLGAGLRVLHVVQPPPTVPEIPVAVQIPDLELEARTYLESRVWPAAGEGADCVIRSGPARVVVSDDCRDWGADLLVVGSHGRGWVDRLLLGSFTEWILNNLPTSVAVVPVSSPQ